MVNVVFRSVVVPALFLALALLAFLPSAAGASGGLEQHCPAGSCETPTDVGEHEPGHDACPATYSCHPTVEHHHGPGAIVILAGSPVMVVPREGFRSGSTASPMADRAAAGGPERPPRFTS